MRISVNVSNVARLVGLNRFEARASAWFDDVVCRLDASLIDRAERWRTATHDGEVTPEAEDRVREREHKRARKRLEHVALDAARQNERDTPSDACARRAQIAADAHEAAETRLRDAAAALARVSKDATEPSSSSSAALARARREVGCAAIGLAVARDAAGNAVAAACGVVAEAGVRNSSAVARALQTLRSPDEPELLVRAADARAWYFQLQDTLQPLLSDDARARVQLQLCGKCDGYVECDESALSSSSSSSSSSTSTSRRVPLEIKTRADGKHACATGPWPSERVQLQIYMARKQSTHAYFVQSTTQAPRQLSCDHAAVVHDDHARFLVVHRVKRDDQFLHDQVWTPVARAVEAAVFALDHATDDDWRDFVLADDRRRENALDDWIERAQNERTR